MSSSWNEPVVEQVLDPLAGEHLAPVVLALDASARSPAWRASSLRLAELVEALAHGVFGHTGRHASGPRATVPAEACEPVSCGSVRSGPAIASSSPGAGVGRSSRSAHGGKARRVGPVHAPLVDRADRRSRGAGWRAA